MSDEIAKAWEDALRKVLESPTYKASFAKENLVPVLMGREAARKFTAQFAQDVAASLKELGVIK